MKFKLISSSPDNSRLILFFAGWGMDCAPFGNLARRGYDIALLWDYRTLSLPAEAAAAIAGYDEVCVLAWSLGVAAANTVADGLARRITRRVAVAGTLHPVDDRLGIPAAIYYGTRDNLDERNLAKFYRRMFSSRSDFQRFLYSTPQRDLAGLRDELTAVAAIDPASYFGWDRAYITLGDAIFPPEAQKEAWQGAATDVVELDSPHWQDFQAIIDREFIDKATMSTRFASSRGTYEQNGPVQAAVIDRLCARASDFFGAELAAARGTVLEVGSGSGALSRRLAKMAPQAEIRLWDIAGDCPGDLAGNPRCRFERVDAEVTVQSLQPESLQFIFSASTIQWFNSPAAFLAGCARALRKGGTMALSTFSAGNLEEITAITGHGLPLPTDFGWLDLAKKHFDLLFAQSLKFRPEFQSPLEALRHLKLTGVNSLGGSARQVLRCLKADPDGLYRLTYRPLILILQR